jgi:hypothetical protein
MIGKPERREPKLSYQFDLDAMEARLTRKRGQTILGFKDHRVIDDRCGIITATLTARGGTFRRRGEAARVQAAALARPAGGDDPAPADRHGPEPAQAGAGFLSRAAPAVAIADVGGDPSARLACFATKARDPTCALQISRPIKDLSNKPTRSRRHPQPGDGRR